MTAKYWGRWRVVIRVVCTLSVLLLLPLDSVLSVLSMVRLVRLVLRKAMMWSLSSWPVLVWRLHFLPLSERSTTISRPEESEAL